MQNNITESKWEGSILKVAFQIGHIYKHQTIFRFGGLVTKSCLILAAPQTIAHHAPLSMGFSRQEYWSGLLFPSLGDRPDLGIKLGSPTLQADSLLTELRGKPSKTKRCTFQYWYWCFCFYKLCYIIWLLWSIISTFERLC